MRSQVPQLTSDEWYAYVCLNRFISVSELSEMTGFTEAEAQQHLATLAEQGLTEQEVRQGAVVYRRTSASSLVASGGVEAAFPGGAEGHDDVASAEEDGAPETAAGPSEGLPWKEPDPASRRLGHRVSRLDVGLACATVVALVTALLLAVTDDPVGDNATLSGAPAVEKDAGPTAQQPTDQPPPSPDPEGSATTDEPEASATTDEPEASATTDEPEASATTDEPAAGDLRLELSSYSGEPFDAVPIQGQYVGAEPGTTLRVQRQVDGTWLDFPLPALTGEDGDFSTQVQLGPGSYQLRVADPESDVVSDVMTVRLG